MPHCCSRISPRSFLKPNPRSDKIIDYGSTKDLASKEAFKEASKKHHGTGRKKTDDFEDESAESKITPIHKLVSFNFLICRFRQLVKGNYAQLQTVNINKYCICNTLRKFRVNMYTYLQ